MSVGTRAVAATLTVLLHLLILAMLAFVTMTVGPPPLPAFLQQLSAERLREAGEQIVDVDIHPGLSASGLVCEGSSYVGVGITAEPGTERIILVGDDTPASRAGLQHDDVVLNPAVWRDAHKEGALLRLIIRRGRILLEVPVLVGKICIG